MATPAPRNVLSAALLAAAAFAVPAYAAEAAKPGAAPKPDPIALAAPADLSAAVGAIEKATGAKAGKLPFGDAATEGRSFEVEPALAERLLAGSHETFKRAGLYLFRYERSFGVGGEKDKLAVLPTADHRVVIRKVGTAQAHHGLTSEKVIAWLDALAKDEPFDLWEVGSDYVAGRFDRAPKDPAAIARRCADFAPDLVAGRASTLDLLAHEIGANRTLYLIW
jgi:hypothetical protein